MTRYPGSWPLDVFISDGGALYIDRIRCMPREARVIAGWILGRRPTWKHYAPTYEQGVHYSDWDRRWLVGRSDANGCIVGGRWLPPAEADALAHWILETIPQPKWWQW